MTRLDSSTFKKMTGIFITGTDTGVGKTYVTSALLHHYAQQGLKTIALKPVSSGAIFQNGMLQNEDALCLQAAATETLAYHEVNPYCFEPAIAPHIAARQASVTLSASALAEHCDQIMRKYSADRVLIEGAGGFLTPLNDTESLADLAKLLNCDIVMVVSLKLGCINHAKLTEQAVHITKLRLLGWVANIMEPTMPALADNISYLQQQLAAPLLGYCQLGQPLVTTFTLP